MWNSANRKISIDKLPSGIVVDSFIRSSRRTVGLQIASDGRLIVRAPMQASLKDIQSFILEKRDWIIKTQGRVRKQVQVMKVREFREGEQFPYLGRNFELHLVDNGASPLQFDNAFYLSSRLQKQAKDKFIDWYRARSLNVISSRVEMLAAKHSLQYGRIRISNAHRRWGSCSAKGNLNFNWRLIMAPIIVIDYVIIHELAHLIERNHSARFWKRVETMMPDYKTHRKWLRENGKVLDL
jgi:predicted metal-dependent hydrolase